MESNRRGGQVGLLVLVVMGVLVSLALSVASRSLSDVALSRQERENSAAFHLAEQGVEEALNEIRKDPDLSLSGDLRTIGDADDLITGKYGIEGSDSLNVYINEGEVAEINLVEEGGGSWGGNTLILSWTLEDNPSEDIDCSGEGSGNAAAAMEISVVTGPSDPVKRYYVNPRFCNDLGDNNFDDSSSWASSGYRSAAVFAPGGGGYDLPANATAIRMRAVYNGATVRVGDNNLPNQLYVVKSAAEGGDAQKEIEVTRSNDRAGSVFDFALFSNTTIIK